MRLLLVGGDKIYFEKNLLEFKKHFVVDIVYESSEALHLAEFCCYDSIVVDSTLGELCALELCEAIRNLGIDYPIVYLSRNVDQPDRVRALDTGVDVMIRKPVKVEELMAQIKVLTRRTANHINCSSLIKYGDLYLDMKSNRFYMNDRVIPLRRKEFDLLQYLMINRGKIVSKEELLEHVWDKGIEIFSNTVEVHVLNIRSKFNRVGVKDIIRTHRGFGYEIEPCEKLSNGLLSR